MKIQLSDVRRFLHLACKMFKSNDELDAGTVVLTFTERGYSIAMEKSGLMLTYLYNRVEFETDEQVIAVPRELLRDCSVGNGNVDLQLLVVNGENRIVATWIDGTSLVELSYARMDPPDYHLIPDLAWHTVEERNVATHQCSSASTHGEETAPIDNLASCTISGIASAIR